MLLKGALVSNWGPMLVWTTPKSRPIQFFQILQITSTLSRSAVDCKSRYNVLINYIYLYKKHTGICLFYRIQDFLLGGYAPKAPSIYHGGLHPHPPTQSTPAPSYPEKLSVSYPADKTRKPDRTPCHKMF